MYVIYCNIHTVQVITYVYIVLIKTTLFSVQTWGRVRRFWRAHLDVDFNALCKLANREVVGIRTGRV